jgi:hypothetical protein
MFFVGLPLFIPSYACSRMLELIKTSSRKTEYMNNYFSLYSLEEDATQYMRIARKRIVHR